MISIQLQDFDLRSEYEWLRETAGDAGAIVTFTGLVRELYDAEVSEEQQVTSLTLEHYPGMTEKCLDDICREAESRWPLLATRVVHRIGELKAHDQIVFVGCASAHRSAAFEASAFIMDYLKSNAPFWKKQLRAGKSEWVQSRASDAQALDKWKNS